MTLFITYTDRSTDSDPTVKLQSVPCDHVASIENCYCAGLITSDLMVEQGCETTNQIRASSN